MVSAAARKHLLLHGGQPVCWGLQNSIQGLSDVTEEKGEPAVQTSHPAGPEFSRCRWYPQPPRALQPLVYP